MSAPEVEVDPDSIDPQRLTVLLEEAGWRIVGGREGLYTRLTAAQNSGVGRAPSVTVPLDRGAADYILLMSELIARLQEPDFADSWSRTILPRLAIKLADELRFHKETPSPKGFIPWKLGEELLESAKRTLLAGAKAYMEPKRRYLNSHGQFASRYLDRVLMGQTGVASYVVTAFIPVRSSVSLSGGSLRRNSAISAPTIPEIQLYDTDVVSDSGGRKDPTSRDLTKSVVGALDATTEALAHFHATGSLSAFDAGVAQGISYELTTALQGLTGSSDGSDITVEWDPSGNEVLDRYPKIFSFTPEDNRALISASTRFAADEEPSQARTLIGRVHLLTKKDAGGPGIFGMEIFGSEIRKIRVRLSDSEQYHQAVRAHDDDLAIRVTGNLERDGGMFWLYHASVDGIEGPLQEAMERFPNFNLSEIPGQMTIY